MSNLDLDAALNNTLKKNNNTAVTFKKTHKRSIRK